MKKIYIFLMFIFILSTVFSESLKEEVLVFNTQDFPPFSYKENGVVSGPGVDIINAVCDEMGVESKFYLFPWRRAIKRAQSGEANALFVLGWNKERTEWLYFTPPILSTEYGFFVHKDNGVDYKEPNDLSGYTVGVFGPSNTSKSLYKIAETVSDMTVEMTPDDIAPFRKLNYGRINAVFSNRDVGFAIIKQQGLKNIKYAGMQRQLNYYIGFLKAYNDKETVDRFNETLTKLYKEGKIKEILDVYDIKTAKME